MLCVADGACNGYVPDDAGFGRGERPAVNLSWNDGYAYLHWLNRKLGMDWERADRYTYLTEAEWEYAAFAGTQGSTFAPYQSGQDIFTDTANFNGLDLRRDAGLGRYLGATMPVGTYPANAWGLHDMHGNVWEWVEDCYRDRHTAMPNDGRAWLEGPCGARVMKGGSYADPMPELRAANRLPVRPEDRSPRFGLRLAVRLDGAWAPAQSAP
jgi:formylglycine-generating enzyme required for sulfatase activity